MFWIIIIASILFHLNLNNPYSAKYFLPIGEQKSEKSQKNKKALDNFLTDVQVQPIFYLLYNVCKRKNKAAKSMHAY